jgi:Helix-turn-helix domain
MEISVVTPEERLQRFMQLVEERMQENEKAAKRKKNKGFTQVYSSGFKRIAELFSKYPLAGRLYLFLAEHIEPGTGAVVASQELLAEEMEVTTRTIRTATKWLEDNGALLRVRLGAGSIYAYCLDPSEVWKSWDTSKKYAAFNTKTLARQKDNGDIKRRLMVMLKGNDPSDVESDT